MRDEECVWMCGRQAIVALKTVDPEQVMEAVAALYAMMLAIYATLTNWVAA